MAFANESFRKILRVTGIIVFIGIGLIPLYQRFVEPQIDNINRYAEMLGGQLLSMVPESKGKEDLAQSYNEFMEKVKNREIEPERVEKVAAGILNASSTNQTLSPEEAEAILAVALYVPEADSTTTVINVNPPPKAPRPVQEWAEAGERVKYAFDFQEKVKEKHKSMPEAAPIPRIMNFQFSDGLKIVIDSNIKSELKSKDLEEIAIEVERLEAENLVKWEEDYLENMEIRFKKLEKSLEKMRLELENQTLQPEDITVHAIQAVKSLEIIDSLGIPIPVNIDSIIMNVEKELQSEGIYLKK